MGCNDFGQVMIEENVVSAAGTTFAMDAEEVERHIRDAGFRPARRNMRYERLGAASTAARLPGGGRARRASRDPRRRPQPWVARQRPRRGARHRGRRGRARRRRVVAVGPARRGRGAPRRGRAARRGPPPRARERPPPPRALAPGGRGGRRRGAPRLDRALRLGPGAPRATATRARRWRWRAEDLVRAGVAAVGDVSNTLGSVAPLGAAGPRRDRLPRGVRRSRPRRVAEALAAAKAARAAAPPRRRPGSASRRARTRSTRPTTRRSSSCSAPGPASIHLAEDPAERALVSTGAGRASATSSRGWAAAPATSCRRRARRWRWSRRTSPPHHLAVHCVDLDDEDVALLARVRGDGRALPALEPASSAGALPPLDALLAAGVPLAIGTDSLASCPSLAPLADAAAAPPRVPGDPGGAASSRSPGTAPRSARRTSARSSPAARRACSPRRSAARAWTIRSSSVVALRRRGAPVRAGSRGSAPEALA